MTEKDDEIEIAVVREQVNQLRKDFDQFAQSVREILQIDTGKGIVRRELFDEARNQVEAEIRYLVRQTNDAKQVLDNRVSLIEQSIVNLKGSISGAIKVGITAFVAPIIVAWIVYNTRR